MKESLVNQISNALHRAHLAFQRSAQADGRVDTKIAKSNRFVEPDSHQWIEQHRRWRPEGYYRLHCAHDRPRWQPCNQCKRGQKEAFDNFFLLMSGKMQ